MDQSDKKELPQAIYVALKDLRLNQDNPRIIKDKKFDKLVKSIKEFPEMLQARPLVVNKDFIILGGNMRYRACVEAGLAEVPVLIAENWSDAKQLEFIIKDNASFGEWDWDVLANEWDDYPLEDWGVTLPRIDPAEPEPDNEKANKVFKVIVKTRDIDEQEKCFDMLLAAGYDVQKK